MIRNFMLALFGALVGGGLIWLVAPSLGPGGDFESGPEGPSEAVARAGSTGEVETLREELEAQRSLNRTLRRRIAELETSAPGPADEGARSLADAPPPFAVSAASEVESASAKRPWFDADPLEAAGLPAGETARIRARWEEYVLAKLDLENERARRGSDWKEAAGQKAFVIESEVRRDLGEAGYDAMLFASGQFNRVIFSELLESSPAAAAGLAAGDELVSYDGQRIFTPSALRYLSALGERGDWIPIRILRDDQELRFFVRRGPLGARLEMAKRPPYAD